MNLRLNRNWPRAFKEASIKGHTSCLEMWVWIPEWHWYELFYKFIWWEKLTSDHDKEVKRERNLQTTTSVFLVEVSTPSILPSFKREGKVPNRVGVKLRKVQVIQKVRNIPTLNPNMVGVKIRRAQVIKRGRTRPTIYLSILLLL